MAIAHLANHVRAHAEPLEILGEKRKRRVECSREADAEWGENAMVNHVPPGEDRCPGRRARRVCVVVHQNHTRCSQRVDVWGRDLLGAVQGHIVESTVTHDCVSTSQSCCCPEKTWISQIVGKDEQYVWGELR